jgi:hypothetical protein
MRGWRRSADRTGLPRNSLQTGNFTGKFEIWACQETSSKQETPALQAFLGELPGPVNRENLCPSREAFICNRELNWQKSLGASFPQHPLRALLAPWARSANSASAAWRTLPHP